METYREVINDRDWIWIGHSKRYNDYLVDAYRKVEGGIKYFVNRLKEQYLADTDRAIDKYGVFSKRPFQIGQGCDGSGDSCCFALYHHFCLSHQLDSVELHKKAYFEHDGSSYQEPIPEEIVKFADWQGVEYPEVWTEQAYQKLIKSLLDINNRSLVAVLESTVEELNFSFPQP